MATATVRYGDLSRQARDTIRDGLSWMPQTAGLTIAGYVRYLFPDGQWHGDSCGCPDDRCAGYHHDLGEDCGCLPVTLGEYAQAAFGRV